MYYGDEVGMTGGEDPMNRGPFPWPDTGANWGDWSLLQEFQNLARIRRERSAALVMGSVHFLDTPGLLTFIRRSEDGKQVIVCINNSETEKELRIAQLSRPEPIAPLAYRLF